MSKQDYPLIHAAQTTLKKLGFYSGIVDGVDGPLTQRGLALYRLHIQPQAQVVDADANLETPYDYMRSLMGLREIKGSKHEPIIVEAFKLVGAGWIQNDEEAWCGAIMGLCCIRTGYQTPNPTWTSIRAKAWSDVGQSIPIASAKKGDLVVVGRTGGFHVAFVHYVNPATRKLSILGGNQSDSVCVQPRTFADVVACRRLGKL